MKEVRAQHEQEHQDRIQEEQDRHAQHQETIKMIANNIIIFSHGITPPLKKNN